MSKGRSVAVMAFKPRNSLCGRNIRN